jgi:multidrug transporter EmrE-like cation transporter
LLCWGSWPALRRKCEVSVGAFAPINICSQLFTSVLFAMTLGMLHTSQSDISFIEALSAQPIDLQAGAVFLGGFLLGHGDHLGALAMEHIDVGIAYPVYAGCSLVGGNLLNVMQIGTKSPVRLVLGLSFIMCGVCCLAWALKEKEREATSLEKAIRMASPDQLGNESELKLSENLLPRNPGEGKVSSPHGKLTSRQALLLCVVAGCCGSCWSPLSTYARPALEKSSGE